MTKEEAKKKLLDTARAEIGYHEVGDNQTKYAQQFDYDSRLYGFDMNGLAWCDYFVDWLFIHCFGFEIGSAMLYQYVGCAGAACANSAQYFRNNGAFFNSPEVGDQIFFYYSGAINHTGIVESVNGSTVVIIEGNSSDGVRRNTYNLSNSIIAGYGRPIWNLVTDVDAEEIEENAIRKIEVRTMQGKYPLLTIALKNEQREDVKALQCLLKLRGNDSIDVDGFYGKETESIVKAYQSKMGLLADGECGKDTWCSLITG